MHKSYLTGLLTSAAALVPMGWLPVQQPAPQNALPADAPVPAILKAKPRKSAAGDDELRKLVTARYNAAAAEMEIRLKEYLEGRVPLESMVDTARRVVESGLEVSDSAEEQQALREKFLELAVAIEKNQKTRVDAGRISPGALEEARYLRLDAEVQLLRAKRKASPQRPEK
jgi:hypothetical protein